MRFSVSIITLMLLFSCTKGINHQLTTDKGMENYQTSLADALRDMTEDEKKAFNWAVSDFDLPKLHEKYPNSSPKKVIRNEVSAYLAETPKIIEKLERDTIAWDKISEPLKQVTAEQVSFRLDSNFHGLQPTVTATVFNRSGFNISEIKWYAELYINGEELPVADYMIVDNLEQMGGLKTGYNVTRTFTIGFVSGEDSWKTLAVRNAHSHTVKLYPQLDSIKDFTGSYIVGTSPKKDLELAKKNLELAKNFSKI